MVALDGDLTICMTALTYLSVCNGICSIREANQNLFSFSPLSLSLPLLSCFHGDDTGDSESPVTHNVARSALFA
jgi:hypothetical protein